MPLLAQKHVSVWEYEDVSDLLAARSFPRVYNTPRRTGIHRFLSEAVTESGGVLLYASDPKRSPIYLGIRTASQERFGVLVYPFRANKRAIKNRPKDEHRIQIRYGAEESWNDLHPLGNDIAGVDTTLVLGVHIDSGILIGLDPSVYNPLPMGISVEFKDANVTEALDRGWHVFERDNITGARRTTPRAPSGLETIVMFTPDRLLDYIRLERTATDLGLDPALRLVTAEKVAVGRASDGPAISTHDLEIQFEMTSTEILTMISEANRLTTAVKGSVAEYHLAKQLAANPSVASVVPLDKDGMHDFDVMMSTGRLVRVECKNASPKPYKEGDFKVEVQKTRATQGDPAGRLYRIDQFDVIAACLKGPTDRWEFRYRPTSLLEPSENHPGRIRPIQRVTDEWADALEEAL